MVEKILLKITVSSLCHRKSVSSDNNITTCISFHQVVSVDLTKFTTWHCTNLNRHIRIAVEVDTIYSISQFVYNRFVVCKIDTEIKCKVLCLNGSTIDH